MCRRITVDFKIVLTHDEYRMVAKALLLLPEDEGMNLIRKLRDDVRDPADDGPEVEILRRPQ
jgi:hypothetical protein